MGVNQIAPQRETLASSQVPLLLLHSPNCIADFKVTVHDIMASPRFRASRIQSSWERGETREPVSLR